MNCSGHTCPTKETCSRYGCQMNAKDAGTRPDMNQGKQMTIVSRKKPSKQKI